MQRRLIVVVEGFDDFETGKHAVHAVELAPGRLGIEMAAGHDDGQRVFTPGTPGE